MAASESVPLLSGKRGDFREIAQQANAPDTVACCCVESTRLAKVPVIRTMFRKRRPEEKVSKVNYFLGLAGLRNTATLKYCSALVICV